MEHLGSYSNLRFCLWLFQCLLIILFSNWPMENGFCRDGLIHFFKCDVSLWYDPNIAWLSSHHFPCTSTVLDHGKDHGATNRRALSESAASKSFSSCSWVNLSDSHSDDLKKHGVMTWHLPPGMGGEHQKNYFEEYPAKFWFFQTSLLNRNTVRGRWISRVLKITRTT